MDAQNQHLAVSTGFHCVECRRDWTDATERWRLYMATLEGQVEQGLYCPMCASFEFDD
jgi:transposase-like protein